MCVPLSFSIVEMPSATNSEVCFQRTEAELAFPFSLLTQMWSMVFTLRLRGMGSSKSRLLPSCSSRLGSSGPAGPGPTPPRLGTRKGLKLSAESGGEGVEGLDWSLGADQLQ